MNGKKCFGKSQILTILDRKRHQILKNTMSQHSYSKLVIVYKTKVWLLFFLYCYEAYLNHEAGHLDDGRGPGSQQLFGLQDGEEGVGAFEPQAWQESAHHRHHRVVQVQPLDQVLQVLVPERTEKHPTCISIELVCKRLTKSSAAASHLFSGPVNSWPRDTPQRAA